MAKGSSNSFNLEGTASQTAVGTGNSASFTLSHGYWQEFGIEAPCVPGDVTGNDWVDIDDVGFLISCIFGTGACPDPWCCGDSDGSFTVDIDDVVYDIAFIFAGGPAPVEICSSWP